MSSPSPFTRRKFLISSAAAASSAWLLAACGGDGGGDSGPGPQASASQIPQTEIDKALDTETTLTFWTWVPDITNQVKMFTTKYPKIKVNVVNVGQGAPALSEAAHGDPVRAGCAGCGADGVPVHPVLHPR